jgi:hypothetical protein
MTKQDGKGEEWAGTRRRLTKRSCGRGSKECHVREQTEHTHPQRTQPVRHRPQGVVTQEKGERRGNGRECGGSRNTVSEASAPRPLWHRRKERQRARMQGRRRVRSFRLTGRAASQSDTGRVGVPRDLVNSLASELANSSMSNEEIAQPPGQLTFADGAGLGLIVSAWRSLPPPRITLPGRSVPPSPHSLPPTCPSSSSRSRPVPGPRCVLPGRPTAGLANL